MKSYAFWDSECRRGPTVALRLPTPIGPVPFWRRFWSWFHALAMKPTDSTGAR